MVYAAYVIVVVFPITILLRLFIIYRQHHVPKVLSRKVKLCAFKMIYFPNFVCAAYILEEMLNSDCKLVSEDAVGLFVFIVTSLMQPIALKYIV